MELSVLFPSTARRVQIQAKIEGFWAEVGEGTLHCDANRVTFSAPAVRPDLAHLGMTLAPDGRAEVVWNHAQDRDARWWPWGEGLVLSTTLESTCREVTFTPGDGGIYIEVSGEVPCWVG